VEREGQSGGRPDDGTDGGRHYGHWLERTLGPDWVEVEPGIFQPRTTHEPALPEVELEPESLDEALRPKPRIGEPEPAAPSRRGWFRRG
jgi:hypothetical protein